MNTTSTETTLDYPAQVKEAVAGLNKCRLEYVEATKADNPGDQFEDIKNQIVSYRATLVTYINAWSKAYAENVAATEREKSEAYKAVLNDPTVNKSGRLDHVRYMFKGRDADHDHLKTLVDNMKRWDRYYSDLVINIQSSLSNIRMDRRIEGV